MTALALKYRPRQLSDLLGQDGLVRMMRAAIEHDRIAQAYILTGVRGVGKTSTARIIARSVNCEAGPTIEPCGTCRSCREIENDSSLDVIELDAASRNGVGDMREMLESVSYAPMAPGARKIYIIDEAHMLSTQAWNALLKTLEEPPAHVIFIFATTEPRKIPATIQSRCQKFSLARIEASVIAANLARIAALESAPLADGVAETISRAGEGSMRDAISVLDQAIAGESGGEVHLAPVLEMLGRGARRDLITLLEQVVDGEVEPAVLSWRGIIGAGADPIVSIDDFAELLHFAIVASVAPGLSVQVGASPDEAEALDGIVGRSRYAELSGAQKLIFETRPILTGHPNRIQAVEILILRLTSGFAKLRAGRK
jgi:DNA polymerase-3 subunit gamma/tau